MSKGSKIHDFIEKMKKELGEDHDYRIILFSMIPFVNIFDEEEFDTTEVLNWEKLSILLISSNIKTGFESTVLSILESYLNSKKKTPSMEEVEGEEVEEEEEEEEEEDKTKLSSPKVIVHEKIKRRRKKRRRGLLDLELISPASLESSPSIYGSFGNEAIDEDIFNDGRLGQLKLRRYISNRWELRYYVFYLNGLITEYEDKDEEKQTNHYMIGSSIFRIRKYGHMKYIEIEIPKKKKEQRESYLCLSSYEDGGCFDLPTEDIHGEILVDESSGTVIDDLLKLQGFLEKVGSTLKNEDLEDKCFDDWTRDDVMKFFDMIRVSKENTVFTRYSELKVFEKNFWDGFEGVKFRILGTQKSWQKEGFSERDSYLLYHIILKLISSQRKCFDFIRLFNKIILHMKRMKTAMQCAHNHCTKESVYNILCNDILGGKGLPDDPAKIYLFVTHSHPDGDTERNLKGLFLRRVLSPLLRATGRKDSLFGTFHVSLSVCGWYLSWDERAIVFPRDVRSKVCLLRIPVRVGDMTRQEAYRRVSEVVSRWNTKMTYENTGILKGTRKSGNCQLFVHHVLLSLGKTYEQILKEGNRKLVNELLSIIRTGKFDGFKFKEMQFETHRDLDNFAIQQGISAIEPGMDGKKVEKDEVDDFHLLKVIDRAFWMRWESTKEDRYHPLLNQDGSLACPFGDPKKDSYRK